ncbi:MAG TPA: glycoside hydrolase family 36 protein, partial [Candidatus Xenobia bacterium]
LFVDGWHSWEPGGFHHDSSSGSELALWADMLTWRSLLAGFPDSHRGRGRVRVGRRVRIHHTGGEPLWITSGRHPSRLLEAYAGARRDVVPRVGWCSWYHHQQYVTEDDVLAAVAHIRRQFPALGLVQIDDGWQKDHGGQPHGGAGDWLEANAKFPHGLAWLADRIRAEGLQAGLWLAPFLTTSEAEFARAHPEAIRDPSQPVWLHAHPCRVVDGGYTAARQWFRELAGQLTQHFDYLKLDFLYAGADNVAAWRQGMASLREGAGDAFLLGCGAPLVASRGLVDGMRVGGDVGPRFAEPYGVAAGVRGVLARAWSHRRWWVADPDCLLLSAPLHDDAWLAHLTLVGMTGGMIMLGDDLGQVPDHRRAWLERILPPHEYALRSLPGALWFRTPQAVVLALFNVAQRATWRRLPMVALGLDHAHVYDVWGETYLGWQSEIRVRVPAEGCRCLRITPAADGPVSGQPGHLWR